MKNLLLSYFLMLTACASTTAPASDPIYYAGLAADVYATIVQAISTSPGLDNSSGWMITQSDAAGYFVRAETLVTPVVLGVSMTLIMQQKSESLSVIVSQQESRTQVILQFTEAGRSLADFIKEQLNTKFESVNQL